MEEYINITLDNIDQEHICCAISDKKHFEGVFNKKEWLKKRITEGHVFRKLNVQGKVFVEYAPLEKAWVPIEGNGFLYIYCLWVSGKFKGHGYGKQLLEYVINDAKKKGKQGVCVISSKKKKSYLADKKFFLKYGFEVVGDVQNGSKALEFLKYNMVDVVFTDIDMPEIDGIELMERCRTEYPDRVGEKRNHTP